MKNEIIFGFEASTADVINNRRMINGEDDGLMQVHPLKHTWAGDMFKTMLQNTWVPAEVPMGPDVEQWNSGLLTEQEKRMFLRSLAFVSNLDGIQTNNLVHNIMKHITSPEVNLVLVRQAFEEALHVHSYATMIEALGFDPQEVYTLYKTDLALYSKNQYVLNAVSKVAHKDFETDTFENKQMFLEACIGNVILEGVYFYSAFLNFYVLKRNNKMPNSADMIQFINRDEDTHLKVFINIVQDLKAENPELWTDDFKYRITQNIIGAVEHEIAWGLSCIGDGILGLNPKSLSEYLMFIGDVRLQQVGLPKHWNMPNPFPWIDEYTQGSMTETNFFEGTVREYSTGSLSWE